MATIVQSVDTTSTITLTQTNNNLLLLPGVTAAVADAQAINTTGNLDTMALSIGGTVASGSGIGIGLGSSVNTATATLTIASTGSVTSLTSDAVQIGLGNNGGGFSLINNGSIFGGDNALLAIKGEFHDIVNHGAIQGGHGLVFNGGVFTSINANDAKRVGILNTGTIGATTGAGIYSEALINRIQNSGIISGANGTGTESAGAGGAAATDAIHLVRGNSSIVNSGEILGDIAARSVTDFTLVNSGHISGSIFGGQTNTGGTDTVTNREGGVIEGAIEIGDQAGRIFNEGTMLYDVAGGDFFLNGDTGLVFGTVLLFSNNNRFDNSGTVTGDFMGGSGNDIVHNRLGGEVDNLRLFAGTNSVFNSGYIDGVLTGAGADTVRNFAAGQMVGNVSLGDGVNSVFNHGAIAGTILGLAQTDTVRNGVAGTIAGNINLGGGANSIHNLGTIDGNVTFGNNTDSIFNAGGANWQASVFDFGAGAGNGKLVNAGSMNVAAITSTAGNFLTIINRGEITNDTITNIYHLFNSGDLNGGQILFTNIDNTAVNSGRIVASVLLGGGNDIFDGDRGVIEGPVPAAFLPTFSAATILHARLGGIVDGGNGNDVIHSGRGNDILLGGNGRDVLDGGDGIDSVIFIGFVAGSGVQIHLDNTVVGRGGQAAGDVFIDIENAYGTAVDDILNGSAGDNMLAGGGGGDQLNAKEGNDTVFGDDGDDTMAAGDGNDFVFGGTGADSMDGGAGSDVFVYTALADSTVAAGGRDSIVGYEYDADRIDVSALGFKVLNAVAGAAFSNTVGELIFDFSAGNTIISGDADGDGTADFSMVLVASSLELISTDFILA